MNSDKNSELVSLSGFNVVLNSLEVDTLGCLLFYLIYFVSLVDFNKILSLNSVVSCI